MTQGSRYLGHRALRTLERLGDVMCPGEGTLPRFGDTGCIAWTDQILEVTPSGDVRDLNRLLTALSFLPAPLLVALLRRAADAERAPGPLRPLLRQFDLGLRGLVYSLYYSGKGNGGQSSGVLEALQYDVHCEEN
ncbi:MAG: hypothetical protein D6758_09220 [Gammaproteobacteria bacterium]|nr:MAG: hypothetical protein D6758_09220 [Gammaproteobacteria bacterium]